MASYVYLVTNLISNKHYIGKTNHKNIRWSQHKSKARTKTSNHFYNSIRKYGKENFTFEILKEFESEIVAYEYERVLVKLFSLKNRKYGLNSCDGGGRPTGYKVKNKIKKYFKEKYTGSKSIRAKFTDEDIINILNEYSSEKYTTYELAKKYSCGKSTMIRIINGDAYSNIIYDRSNFKKIGIKNRLSGIPSGINVKLSKLSVEEVKEIRKLYLTGKYSYQDLSTKFKVTKSNIYHIIKNKTRKDGTI